MPHGPVSGLPWKVTPRASMVLKSPTVGVSSARSGKPPACFPTTARASSFCQLERQCEPVARYRQRDPAAIAERDVFDDLEARGIDDSRSGQGVGTRRRFHHHTGLNRGDLIARGGTGGGGGRLTGVTIPGITHDLLRLRRCRGIFCRPLWQLVVPSLTRSVLRLCSQLKGHRLRVRFWHLAKHFRSRGTSVIGRHILRLWLTKRRKRYSLPHVGTRPTRGRLPLMRLCRRGAPQHAMRGERLTGQPRRSSRGDLPGVGSDKCEPVR